MVVTMAHGQGGAEIATDRAPTLTCNHEAPIAFHPTQDPISSTDGSTHAMGTGNGQGCATVAVAQPIAIQDVRPIEKAQNGRGWNDDGTAYTVDTHATQGVAHTLKGEGFDASEDGTGRGTPLVPVAQPLAYTTKMHNTQSNNAGKIFEERSPCLDANSPAPALLTAMAVRRLTPVECERLQGFPDGYTNIPWRKKPESPDGPRYKALGNSWAVPVVRWIGKRIKLAVEVGA